MDGRSSPARLDYFEQWVHPVAGKFLSESSDIEVLRIDPRSDPAIIEGEMARMDGCQSLTRTDATLSGTGDRWLANAQFTASCPRLLALFTAGAGYDIVDVDACTQRGILVCNQSGVALEGVAEHCLGFMLVLSKKISLTDTTRSMFGEEQFASMKPGAFFLTTARGGVHDEAALANALASGHLGGAGIDVFDTEPPPPNHPLFALDNVVATPHSADVTAETTRDIAIATADLWKLIFAGEPPKRVINPEAWPLYAERFEARFGLSATPMRHT